MNLNIHAPMPVRKDWRIGILGSGFIVNDCHLVSYRKCGFNPVAIASRTKENAAKVAARHGIPKVCETYEQLLDDASIEVLDIAVPPDAQLALIKAACAKGTVKGILAQKPLGMDYAEALEAVLCCERAGIVLSVNQNMRYDQSVRAARTLLEDGTIGQPVFASIDMRGIPHYMPWQQELGWVTLRIMSIHHLDCLRYWFGDPEGIYCSTRPDPRIDYPHTDGICTYILEYANGLRCVGIDDTWTGPAREGCPADLGIKWRIEGTNGLAMGDIGWCKDPYTSASKIRYAKKGDAQFHEPVWTESWFPDAFGGTMAQLLIALETGESPAISGRDNLKTMALVDAAYQSAVLKRMVTIKEIETNAATKIETEQKVGKGFFEKVISKVFGGQKSKAALTTDGQFILTSAITEARRLKNHQVNGEHLLLGILDLGQGTAWTVLVQSGLDPKVLRTEIEKSCIAIPGQTGIGKTGYSAEAKKVISNAGSEAEALGHNYICTEHILLGLLQESNGVAIRAFNKLGVNEADLRKRLLRLIGKPEGVVKKAPAVTPEIDAKANNFTPRAQQVLAFARKEADLLNHNFVGTEHVLLGLIRLGGQGVAFNILQKRGFDLETIRGEVEKYIGKGPDQKVIGNIPYTPRVKKVLSFAAREAKALNHTYVGTEHILLGLLREEDGPTARCLKSRDLDIKQTRIEILKELDPNIEP